MRIKITEELIAKMQSLRNDGKLIREIAEILGIAKTTVSKYTKKLVVIEDIVGVPIRPIATAEPKLTRKERRRLKKANKKK